MKPEVDRTLQLLAGTLVTEVAPLVSLDYGQKSLGLTAMLLQTAAEEFDRAAARRVEENRQIRRLFEEAASDVTDPALRDRLTAAASEPEGELRVSALDEANARLRALLIELHAHVEQQPGPAARRIEAAIWSELRASTERRRLALAPF